MVTHPGILGVHHVRWSATFFCRMEAILLDSPSKFVNAYLNSHYQLKCKEYPSLSSASYIWYILRGMWFEIVSANILEYDEVKLLKLFSILNGK